MKILVYGGKGWIGQQVVQYLEQKKKDYILGKARVENTKELEKEIEDVNPTNILCLIGRTHGNIGDKNYTTIDYLEQKGKIFENVRDNLFSPVSLGLICLKKNIHLLCLNTGCIFTYDETHDMEHGFLEEDKPNFFDSSYSVVKGFTDQLMHQLPVCNLRIRMPISSQPNSRNFITKIVNYEKICNMSNSMTVLDELIPIMISLAEQKFLGTLNFTNPGVISHNEILEMYKEIVDPEFKWENFSYEEQNQILAAGRSNNYLETELLTSLFNVTNIRESVESILHKYKENLDILN